MGSVKNPKEVFGEEGIERGSVKKDWDDPLSEGELEESNK